MVQRFNKNIDSLMNEEHDIVPVSVLRKSNSVSKIKQVTLKQKNSNITNPKISDIKLTDNI